MSQKKLSTKTSKARADFNKKYQLAPQILGRGSYAEVRLAVNRESGEQVAVKMINKKKMKFRDFDKVKREIKILSELKHVNIVQILDAFSDKNFYYIVMEYASAGDLFSKIVENDEDMSEKEIKEIVRKLSSALKYCKDHGVVHRDLKPENILITSANEIKLADFNLSKKVSTEAVKFSVLETECGTPNYVAPEVLSQDKYDYKCDIWSLGIITFVLLSGGYLPFFPDDEESFRAKTDLLEKVKEGKWDFVPEHAWKNVSNSAKDLLTKMLVKDPQDRITYEAILTHEWLNPDIGSARLGHINYKSLALMRSKVFRLKAMQRLDTAHVVFNAVKHLESLMIPPQSQIANTQYDTTDF